MRVLVFGDSITQGYWAIEHGWVDRLRLHYDSKQIKDLNGRDEPTFFNLGISADNSGNILKRIVAEITSRSRENHTVKPVVIVQIGVNDSSTGVAEHSVHVNQENYKENLVKIINNVRDLSSKIIFIGSSACDDKKTNPVSWGDYFYKNKDIKKYETIMAQVAKEQDIYFIAVFDEFKKRLDSGEALLADGLHPSELGHELMYKIIQPQLQELLK